MVHPTLSVCPYENSSENQLSELDNHSIHYVAYWGRGSVFITTLVVRFHFLLLIKAHHHLLLLFLCN